MTHEGATHVNIIGSIITDAISPGLDEYESLNAEDRENISRLFLEVGFSIIKLKNESTGHNNTPSVQFECSPLS